ncbi:hypothetical protein SK128_001526 [Halocaridina rubra]|uniref:Uncharacterized protein n=1 Tax=Halocaridina rubra TaxID=373956 RepID=A0AAN8WTR7_HALRR
MREVLDMAKGTPGDAGGLRGLLSLEEHPDLQDIFKSSNVEDDYDVEKEPIARAVRQSSLAGNNESLGGKLGGF